MASWEPNITIQSIDFVPHPDVSGVVVLDISFSVGANPTVHAVTLSLGGDGIEIMAQAL